VRPAPDPFEDVPELELPEAMDVAPTRPPPAPQLKPSPLPFFEDIPEFTLPDCANPEMSSTPPTPRLRPAAVPLAFQFDMSEFQLPDAMEDEDMCASETAPPGQVLADQDYSSEEIFILDGFSDSSSNADVNELSLGELFDCDTDDGPDSLESSEESNASVKTSNSGMRPKEWEDSAELKAPAPIKVINPVLKSLLYQECGSPIFAALWRASSNCSTRECTPSPKGDNRLQWRKQAPRPAQHQRTC
jgi:hypothetical protein